MLSDIYIQLQDPRTQPPTEAIPWSPHRDSTRAKGDLSDIQALWKLRPEQ
jgi:hypothetical protein